MKKVIQSIAIVFALFTITSVSAQTSASTGGNMQEVKIKTSAVCGSCRKTIEKAAKSVDGVQSASLNLSDDVATVNFDATKTNADAIRTAISKSGYDADDVKADKEAYDNLESCCKKDSD